LGGIFTAVLVLVAILLAVRSQNKQLLDKSTLIPRPSPPLNTESGSGETFLSDPFDIDRTENLEIDLYSPVQDRWLFVTGTLVNQTTNEARDFGIGVSYYHGVEDGESWSEGSFSRSVYLGSVYPGSYVMKMTPEWGPANAPPEVYRVVVCAGVFLPSHLVTAIFLLWGLPVCMAMAHWSFEKRRWSESNA
jgi:hypothetical protein